MEPTQLIELFWAFAAQTVDGDTAVPLADDLGGGDAAALQSSQSGHKAASISAMLWLKRVQSRVTHTLLPPLNCRR